MVRLTSFAHHLQFAIGYSPECAKRIEGLPNISALRTHFLETDEEYEPIFISL